MYIVVCEISKQSPDHPWAKYRKRDGRFEFQMDLAHAIIECGISLDCPDLEDLRDRKKRPGYMRKQDWIPCDCNRCFFCKHGFTHGIAHKPAVGRRTNSTTENPIKCPTVEGAKRMKISDNVQYCRVCYQNSQRDSPEMPLATRRKSCKQSTLGCPGCGPIFSICKGCWKEWDHNPN